MIFSPQSICNRFAAEYNVNIPHTRIYQGFSQTFSNKRTALKENLLRFTEEGAFKVIEHICNLNHYKDDVNFKEGYVNCKKANKQRIEAVDLLLAITDEPNSLAMKVLDSLGVDAAEIRHGIQGIN